MSLQKFLTGPQGFFTWSSFRALAFALALVAGAATQARAQATSGVTGVVTDTSGGTIAGVSVTLNNSSTGYSVQTKTDSEGVYEFRLVPPGDGYSLTFSMADFRTVSLENLHLGVGVTETKNAQLPVGDITQKVEVAVQGEGSLNTTDASIGHVMESDRAQDLPFQIRLNVGYLLALQPGVQSELNRNSAIAQDAQDGSVTGARADQQNITIDGLDVMDETIGQSFYTIGRAPLDAVQEVRTIVGNADSTYGRSSSAQVDIVTKSGTNDFHGSLREYNRNTSFEANSFFNNLTGLPRGPLIRNQFGSDVGGPILKNKLFFFFDYDGLRTTAPSQQLRDVPVEAVRDGGLNYINNNPGCTSSARLNTQPGCITTVTSAQVKAMDPAGIGTDEALVHFLDQRYPEPNFPSGGDGVNTEGFLFNAPDKASENTFIGKLDYTLNSKHKLFARGTWDRDRADETLQQFPGDPEAVVGAISHNRSGVVGDTWQVKPNVLNNLFVGLTRSILFFPSEFAPTAPNLFGFGTNSSISVPYGDFRGQGRNVAVPEVRDQLSWEKGRHTVQFGGDFKPIRYSSLLSNSVTFPIIGLGGNTLALNSSLRPANIYQTSTDLSAVNNWDGMFPIVLGRYAEAPANFNYDLQGNPLTIGSPALRNWAYNETELYAQDTWRIRSDLTLLYGLRWQFHGVPYEQHGFESVADISEPQLFGARVAAAAQGINGNTAAPLVSYNLAGSYNQLPGYYQPDFKDFAPRIGVAYSPSFTSGFLGKLLGDRKTSIRGGAGVVYDRVLNTLEFELDQSNFLFSNMVPLNFGLPGEPAESLQNDPRFTSLATPPTIAASPIPRPYTPNVDSSGNPIGLAFFGGFPTFFNFNQNLKLPYAVTASFGVQRELPGNFIVEADYFGRFGRRLVAIGDAAQQLNFKDPKSGQFLNTAFANVQRQMQSGTPATSVTAQPWFEHQVGEAVEQNYGTTCQGLTHGLNCTQLSAFEAATFIPVGDLSSTDLVLSEFGLLLPNTGLDAQTGSAGYIGNFSSSDYNSLLLTVRKRLSYNLEFDFDYAYAHSIDNVSDINNDFVFFDFNGQGLVCDLRNLRTCRGNSDFDARHTFSANYIYTLPVGRGQHFLGGSSKLLDLLVGGWGTSGIVTWHAGYPLNTSTNTFPIDFTQSAPAVYVGPASDVARGVHVVNGQVQYFANPVKALSAFQYPFGGGTGNRNVLRGPNYSNIDMGIFKNFNLPWSENQRLQLRADAFNVFNNVSFAAPSTAIDVPGTFGVITLQENTPRVLQVALRFDF